MEHTKFFMSGSTRIIVAMFVTAVTGCTDPPTIHTSPDTPPIGTERAMVTGHIVDANGIAVAGATVELRSIGTRVTADTSGAFALDVPANTTLTVAASAPGMAPTLLQQFMVSPGATATFDVPLLATAHLTSLIAMGGNAMGGVVAISLKSMSGTTDSAAGATVDISPANLGRVLYAPPQGGMPDPDPSMTAIVHGTPLAWAVGVQPHVTVLTLALHGVSQVSAPYAIDEVTWPGTFTVDPGALTLITLFTP
jgi:hypothetical protein